MPSGGRRPWEKYWTKFQYLLPYQLDETYPYKQLAEQLEVHPNAIRQMIRWICTQPEVIKYLRDNFTPESLPDWVGHIEGENATPQDNNDAPSPTMEADSDDTTAGDDIMDDSTDTRESIAPTQASTVGDVRKVVSSGAGQGGVDHGGVGNIPPDKKKQKAPPPLVEVNKKLTPKTKPPGIREVMTSAKLQLAEEIKRLQAHDPDIVPVEGGGYGKIIKNEKGQFVSIQPIEQPIGASSPQLEQLVAETTLEDLSINTLGLLRRVALNPAVTMGYAYVTNTVDPASGKLLFKGDLADWINWCVEQQLRFAFGVKFGIFTGMPSLKDLIPRGESQ